MGTQLFRVKGLEWEWNETESMAVALTPFGPYRVGKLLDGVWFWMAPRGQKFLNCDSYEDGKAQAEAHYRERMLPALEPVESHEAELREENKAHNEGQAKAGQLIGRLLLERFELREVLKSVEWGGSLQGTQPDDVWSACLVCGVIRFTDKMPHAPDCKLAAALAKVNT